MASDNADTTVDVVVVGYGFAGANAAIAAHDEGASVLVLEKMPRPGGISICSAGGVRVARDAQAALTYLEHTNADTAPTSVLRALAEGMTTVGDRVAELAALCGATTAYKPSPGTYPFPGRETFGFVMIDELPGFDVARAYPHVRALGAGAALFQVLERNVAHRGIDVWTDTAAARLLRDDSGRLSGVRATRAGHEVQINARRAVILACGGFEADPAMQAQYWQGRPVVSCAFRGNTGDGIRMAQAVGADLWHMWHYHGTYGFRVDGYPLGVRTKRLPDWYPGGDDPEFDTMFNDGRAVAMPWILLSRDGNRFMNEYEPYLQDTGHRPFDRFRPETQDFPNLPSWLVADDDGRALFPWGQPLYNDGRLCAHWSRDNLTEVEAGVITRADSLDQLAATMALDPHVLHESVARWNAACEDGRDHDFGRPPSSMRPISTAPFFCARIWPVVSNTQGGPVHDARQRVLDPFGVPIDGLFAAGELGSVFGHLYLSGGNVSECFVGGRIAGAGAAKHEN